MHLDADMVRNEAHDPLGVRRGDAATGVFEPAGKAIDPEMTVRIEHDLDDAGIFQIAGDRWSEGGAQHARAAQESFGSEGERRHSRPRVLASVRRRMCRRG